MTFTNLDKNVQMCVAVKFGDKSRVTKTFVVPDRPMTAGEQLLEHFNFKFEE